MSATERYLPFFLNDRAYETAPRLLAARVPRPAAWRTLGYHMAVFGVYLAARTWIAGGRFGDKEYMELSFRVLRAVERFGGRVRISGMEHLQSTPGAAVIVSNHMSALETGMLPCTIGPFRPVAFVIKESLFRYPIYGPIMKALRMIPVSRQNPRDDLKTVLEQGVRLLGEGVSLVIFPQSTRTVEFDPSAFNSLGVKLAARAGVPVIPVALKTDFVLNGRRVKDFGPVDPGREVRLRFGPPLRVQGNGKAEHEAVVRFISENLREWGVRVLDGKGAESGSAV